MHLKWGRGRTCEHFPHDFYLLFHSKIYYYFLEFKKKKKERELGCSSVVEICPCTHEAPSSIPSSAKREKKKTEQDEFPATDVEGLDSYRTHQPHLETPPSRLLHGTVGEWPSGPARMTGPEQGTVSDATPVVLMHSLGLHQAPYNLPQHSHPLTSCRAQAFWRSPSCPWHTQSLGGPRGRGWGGFLKLGKIFTHTLHPAPSPL